MSSNLEHVNDASSKDRPDTPKNPDRKVSDNPNAADKEKTGPLSKEEVIFKLEKEKLNKQIEEQKKEIDKLNATFEERVEKIKVECKKALEKNREKKHA